MSGIERLRKFNTVLLTIALLMGIALLANGLWTVFGPESDFKGLREVPAEPDKSGEVWSNGAKRYTVYSYEHEDDPEALRGIKIIDMTTGRQLAVSDDPDRKIYGLAPIRFPEGADYDTIGFVALVRTGGTNRRPLFDLVIGDLAWMRQTTAARGVRYLDQPTGIDPRKISMVVDDASGSSFRVFDLSANRFTINEPIEFEPQARAKRVH